MNFFMEAMKDYTLDELQLIANLADKNHIELTKKDEYIVTRDIAVCVIMAIKQFQVNSEIDIPSTADAIDRIEKENYSALYYFPGVNCQENSKLWDALEALKNSGHIIVDKEGSLVGQVAKVRMDPQEKAEMLRSKFKIIENETE